jgi:putative endopeptidase
MRNPPRSATGLPSNTFSSTFRQLGADSTAAARKKAADVFALETKLATASRKLADLRDPNKNYNKLSHSALKNLNPSYLLG